MPKIVENFARCPEHGLHGQRTACFVCDGPVEQVAMVPARYELAARRLAERLADAATTAPGGTGWPSFKLPDEFPFYAIVGWLGERVFEGGADPADAKRKLAETLLKFALDEWQGPDGEPFDLVGDLLPDLLHGDGPREETAG